MIGQHVDQVCLNARQVWVDAGDRQAQGRVGNTVDGRYRVGLGARLQKDTRDCGRVLGRALHLHAIGGDIVEKSGLVGEGSALMDQAGVGAETHVIATGGLGSLIGTASHFIKDVDELLTLEGLRIIWDRNQSSSLRREGAPKAAKKPTAKTR